MHFGVKTISDMFLSAKNIARRHSFYYVIFLDCQSLVSLSGWCKVMSKWAKDGNFPYYINDEQMRRKSRWKLFVGRRSFPLKMLFCSGAMFFSGEDIQLAFCYPSMFRCYTAFMMFMIQNSDKPRIKPIVFLLDIDLSWNHQSVSLVLWTYLRRLPWGSFFFPRV